MYQKFQLRSKTSKILIKTRDILGPNVIVTLQSLHYPAKSVVILKISFRINCFCFTWLLKSKHYKNITIKPLFDAKNFLSLVPI